MCYFLIVIDISSSAAATTTDSAEVSEAVARFVADAATQSIIPRSTGSARSQFDTAIAILRSIGESASADSWVALRGDLLTAFGRVRTVSDAGKATRSGVDYGSASLAKAVKAVGVSDKRMVALLASAWSMASAMAMAMKSAVVAE